MLTEDYYFAFQCYRSGCTVGELLQYPSTIEAAHTVTDWWGQRKRWMRGYAQVFHALVGGALRPRGHRDLLAAVICGNTLLGSILLISLLSKVLVLLLIGAGEFVLLPVVTVVTLSTRIRALDARNGVVDGVGLAWLLSPLLFPLYRTVAAKALLEYLVGRRATGTGSPRRGSDATSGVRPQTGELNVSRHTRKSYKSWLNWRRRTPVSAGDWSP